MRFNVPRSRSATSPAGFDRRTSRLAAGALLTLALVGFLNHASLASESRPVVGALVYYSNFAPPEALASANYRALLDILGRSRSPKAAAIRESVLSDVENAPKELDRDVRALSAGAWSANVDLFVFSNALALQGRYLRFDHRTRSVATADFQRASEDGDALLSLLPLSRPGRLKAALQAVRDSYPGAMVDMALIVKSHGADDIPLVPRVNLDFTKVNPKAILDELDGAPHSDLGLPETVLRGTSQQEFWRVLAAVGDGDAVRFPLVFLSSRQSAPFTWDEVFAIPGAVGRIAHTVGLLQAGAID